MSLPDKGYVGGVIEEDEVPAPAHPNRIACVEGNLQRRLETLWPRLEWNERSPGPVLWSRMRSLYLPASAEEIQAVVHLALAHDGTSDSDPAAGATWNPPRPGHYTSRPRDWT